MNNSSLLIRTLAIISIIPIFVGCGADQNSESQSELPADNMTIVETPTTTKTEIKLIADLDDLRIRNQAGTEGKVLDNLNEGDKMIFSGEISDFTTAVRLRGYPYQDPWLKVKTKDGKEGWVYGGGVSPAENNYTTLFLPVVKNRLQKLFGKDLSQQITNIKDSLRLAKTDRDMATVYRNLTSVKGRINQRLHDEIALEEEKIPNVEWMNEYLPNLILRRVAEGTMLHAFDYYEDWTNAAQRTTGKADDRYFEMMYAFYPIDKTEHFYPAYFLQTWDYGGHSELGKGIHFQLFEKLNENIALSDIFAPEIEILKQKLLSDITSKEITYWQPQNKIIAELDKIINAGWGIFTEADKIELETRRKQFENPEQHGIEVNQRAG